MRISSTVIERNIDQEHDRRTDRTKCGTECNNAAIQPQQTHVSAFFPLTSHPVVILTSKKIIETKIRKTTRFSKSRRNPNYSNYIILKYTFQLVIYNCNI